MKESALVINEVTPLEQGVSTGEGVISQVWEKRGMSTPRVSVDRHPSLTGRYSSQSIEGSASPRSSVSNVFQAGLALSGGNAPRMASTTAPLDIASPLYSRLSLANSLEGSPRLSSTARPSIVADENPWVDQEVKLHSTDSNVAQHLFTRASAASYVATLAETMMAPFFSVQCAVDINRVAALHSPAPRHLHLNSMAIDKYTVDALLSYNSEVNDVVDLLFENCIFHVEDFEWLRSLKQLRSIRMKGHYVTAEHITEMLRNAPEIQSLTIFDCAIIERIDALADDDCSLRAIQIIHTNFTTTVFNHIVNCASLREVLLLQIDLQVNIFDLLNTNHIELIQVVSCADFYYETKDASTWASVTSPRVGKEGGRGRVTLSVRSLVISDCESLNVKLLPWSELSLLKHLSIMYQNGVSGEDIQPVLLGGQLRLLRLQQLFVDDHVVELLSACQQLRELNLSFCKGMQGLNALWPHLKLLSRLNLSYSDIEDEDITGIVTRCDHLKEVYVRGCKYIRDFTTFRSLVNLEYLDTTECVSLENASFFGDYRCTKLRKIILDQCPQLYDISPLGAVRSLEDIQLSGTSVRGADMKGLQTCPYLSTVNISGCKCIDYFSMGSLMRLKRIDASHSSLNDTDLAALVKCERLEEVDLSYCEQVFSVADLANIPTILRLNLSYSAVNTEGFNALARHGANLRLDFLNLSGCTGIGDLFDLEHLDTIRTLLLSMSSVSEATLAYIAKCRSIETLDLSGCPQIKYAGDLAPMAALRYLNLSLTSIDDTSLKGIAKCGLIDHIELSGCESITDVSPLTRLPVLERLNLSRTGVYSHTLEGFTLCPLLWDVNIAYCPNVHDISQLSDVKSLQRIDASETKVAGVSFQRSWRCVMLEELSLRNCVFLKSMVPSSLQGLTSIRKLDLSASCVKDVCFTSIAECQSLEELVLDQCPYISSLISLRVLRNLRVFSAVETNIDDSAFVAISLCPSLEVVNVSKCTCISDISPLMYCPKMRAITARDSAVSDLSFLSPWKDSPLLFLDLSHCTEIASLYGIASLFMLQELNLSWSSVSERALTNIANCEALRTLHLSGCQNIKSVFPLHAMPSLKHLDLSKSAVELLTEKGQLWTTTALQVVNLRECSHLLSVSCLCEVTSLRVLDLDRSSVRDLSFSACWEKAIGLDKLVLSSCAAIRDVNAVGDFLNLTNVDLSSSPITNTCVEAMRVCLNLRVVNLSKCNEMTNVSPLSGLPRLQQLILQNCKNLRSVSFSVEWTCPCLLELDLTGCVLVKNLHGIGSLKKLKSLSLAKTSIISSAFTDLIKCQSIERLDFRGCYHLKNFSSLAKLPQLRTLYLSDSGADDNSIVSISRCKLLEILELVRCENVRNLFVPFEFGSLKTLKITAGDSIIGSFMTSCPSLEYLSLLKCPKSFRVSTLEPLRHLRVLDLTGGEVDESIFEPLRTCSANLEELCLKDCLSMTNVAALGQMSRLERLDLTGVPITDSSWQGLLARRTLQTLILRQCEHIRDLTPLRSLTRLHYLDVSRSGIANCSMELLPHLPSLEQFLAVGCGSIVDIRCLYKGLPQIALLDFTGVPLTVEEATLRRNCPYLEIIRWGGEVPLGDNEKEEEEVVEPEAYKVTMTVGGQARETAPWWKRVVSTVWTYLRPDEKRLPVQ
ncbi:leucine-richprotein (LRRP) [Angomonas deanei]|uniref:Leucine Rich repeat n=1 Tax=Angomonas deanei TaxID=59799 RepID=A0A7G2CIR4_9TRYP|nr:leucine-richprotein (LRRP) [Angomonas deanei]CAD2218947.1 hypothetical protein, conserved [Angomonas deanei]|eukprot:EPY23455.1 leucine-richprotein (LRRP) [Angomonas deanei]